MPEIKREMSEDGLTITISSGQTASSSFTAREFAFGSIEAPSTLTGTTFHIEVSLDGTNFVDAYDQSGNQITFTPTVSTAHRIPNDAFPAIEMRIVSDSAEGADRTFKVLLSS